MAGFILAFILMVTFAFCFIMMFGIPFDDVMDAFLVLMSCGLYEPKPRDRK